jgi:long-chain acyl-CoA synthetase
MNFATELDRAAADRPEHPALIFDNGARSWSFRELDLRASCIATGLENEGVRVGDRVAIFMKNWPEHVASWYGVAKAGGVPVDVSTALGDEEWAFILNNCAPYAIVCGSELAPRLQGIASSLERKPRMWVARATADAGTTFETLDSLAPDGDHRPAVNRSDDDLAVIGYTSGTTAVPKGVMHKHGLLLRHVAAMKRSFGFSADDHRLNVLPLFTLHGFLTQPGVTTHVQCSLLMFERFVAQDLFEASQRYVIDSATLVPAMLVELVELPEERRPKFASNGVYFAGSAPLAPELRKRFEDMYGVRVLHGYGSTEVMCGVANERRGTRAPLGSAGRLFDGLDGLVRVVDDDGVDVPPGEIGEFVVHKSVAMMGYWNAPEATADAFLDGEWYRMGDLGRMDEDGYLYVSDRKKDMIIRGGFNIYSAEIERLLVEQPEVAEAIVVGSPHDRLGEVPHAFVVLRTGIDPSNELNHHLIAICEERLGRLKAPDHITFIRGKDVPRNPMGKPLKRDLRDRLSV